MISNWRIPIANALPHIPAPATTTVAAPAADTMLEQLAQAWKHQLTVAEISNKVASSPQITASISSANGVELVQSVISNMPELDSRLSITYCRYSGVVLSAVPKLFDNELPLHFAKHWLFSQTIDALFRYHYDQKQKTHQMRALLTLAIYSHKDMLGKVLQLNHPVLFPETKLLRSYPQLIALANKLRGITADRRDRLLSNIPQFAANSNLSEPCTASKCLQAGSDLLEYLTGTVFVNITHRLDICISYQELETQSELVRQELAERLAKSSEYALIAVPKSPQISVASQVEPYWDCVLQEVESSFNLSERAIKLFRIQLRRPTDLATLTELQTLLEGLLFTSDVNPNLTVTKSQLKLAIADVQEHIRVVNNPPELQLVPAINLPMDKKVEVDIVTGRKTITAAPPQPNTCGELATKTTNPLLAKILASKQQRVDKSKSLADDAVNTLKTNISEFSLLTIQEDK